jgi:hypothetical protein
VSGLPCPEQSTAARSGSRARDTGRANFSGPKGSGVGPKLGIVPGPVFQLRRAWLRKSGCDDPWGRAIQSEE